MSEVTQVNTAAKRRKWLKAVLWVLGIVALTAGLVYLLWILQSHFRVPMRQYASLAYLIVFVATFFTSCTIIFPAPGIVVVMAAASMWNPVIVALVASVGGRRHTRSPFRFICSDRMRAFTGSPHSCGSSPTATTAPL